MRLDEEQEEEGVIVVSVVRGQLLGGERERER